MASRDGLGRTEAVGNSNTLLLAGQIAVSYGGQLLVIFGVKNQNCSGSNHGIAKPRRQNLALIWNNVHGIAKTRRQNLALTWNNVHAKPQLPENFLSKD